MSPNQRYLYEHQWEIVWMANTPAGKHLIDAKPSDNITRVYQNGYERIVEKDRYISVFYPWSRMESIFIPLLQKMALANVKEEHYEAMLHFADLHRKPDKYPSIYLTTSTFTANGGGQGRISASDGTYLTAQTATTGTKSNDTTRPGNGFFFGTTYEIIRGFCPFDTSAIPDGATVTATANTFIRFVNVSTKDDTDSDSVSVVASTQASNTALVGGDFDQVGTTKFATDKTIASISNGNIDYTLNASGVANISLTGYSKFAWRTAKDIAASAPTGANSVQMTDDSNLLSVEFTLKGGIPSAEI